MPIDDLRRQKRGSPVKVLALTAYDDKRFVQQMLKAGAAG